MTSSWVLIFRPVGAMPLKGPPPDQSRGDRVLLDDQFLQLPVVVREGCAHRLDSLDVTGQSIDGPRPAHLLGDELAQLIDAVLVAACEVALVQGNYVSTFESYGVMVTRRSTGTAPAASDHEGDDRAVSRCADVAPYRRVAAMCAWRRPAPGLRRR